MFVRHEEKQSCWCLALFSFLFSFVRQLEVEKPLAPHDLTASAPLTEVPEFV